MFATAEMIRRWNENGKAYFPKVATKAELDAVVAANGGQSLGPAVSVAGVLWGNDGQNNYSPVLKGRKNPACAMLRELSYYGSDLTVANDRTVCVQWPADGDFCAARVELTNYTDAPLTVGPVFIAPAANSGDNGSGLTWVQVFFSGSATVTIPAASRASLGGAVKYDVVYKSAKSDIAYVSSIARADGTKYPLLQTRVYYPSGGVPDILPAVLSTYLTGMDAGKIYLAARTSGDTATSHAAVTLGNAAGSLAIAPSSIEFFYRDPVVSIASFGDSIQSGSGAADTETFPPVGRAVKAINATLSTPAYSYSSHSQAAQKLLSTKANCATTLAITKPAIVRIPTVSPNDGALSAAMLGLAWAYTMQMVEAAELCGARYYLVGPTPSWNGVGTVLLHEYSARVKEWCTRNRVPFLDLLSVLEDPASSGHYLTAYNSGDNAHPSGSGYDAISLLDVSAILQLS